MKHPKFYLLLRRYLRGSLSEGSRERFEKFIDETTLYTQHDAWEANDQAELLERITRKIHDPQPVKKRMTTSRFIVLATSLTVVLLAVYYVVLITMVPAKDMEKTMLNDGTLVWLKEGDRLSYYEVAQRERHVIFSGEALFEVAKDSLRPFIIQCGTTSLSVLGTSFTVRSVHDSVTLSVLTGTVHMYSDEDTTGIRVLPNERVVYAGKGMLAKQGLQPRDIPEYVRETEYNMQFTDVTVEQLLSRIEKKFNVTISVDEARVKRCHVTADFTDHSLDKTLFMLAEVLDITYTLNGNLVTIHGKGCNS